jgi:hypothetical protein
VPSSSDQAIKRVYQSIRCDVPEDLIFSVKDVRILNLAKDLTHIWEVHIFLHALY